MLQLPVIPTIRQWILETLKSIWAELNWVHYFLLTGIVSWFLRIYKSNAFDRWVSLAPEKDKYMAELIRRSHECQVLSLLSFVSFILAVLVFIEQKLKK